MCCEALSEGGKFAPPAVPKFAGHLASLGLGTGSGPAEPTALLATSDGRFSGGRSIACLQRDSTRQLHTQQLQPCIKESFLTWGVENTWGEQPQLQAAESSADSNVEACRA